MTVNWKNNKDEQAAMSRMGKRIEFYRAGHQWTRKTLSEKIGVSETLIFMYEKGRTRIPALTLQRFAQVFDVPYDYLFGDDCTPQAYEKNEFDRIITEVKLLENPTVRDLVLRVIQYIRKGHDLDKVRPNA